MKKIEFIITFTTVVPGYFGNIRYKQNITAHLNENDWKVMEREGFKIENKNLIAPKFWKAEFRPYCCDYSIYISKRNSHKKLLTLNQDRKKGNWEITDCCR